MPDSALKIYDMENCPFCRLAREALEELGLDYELYPSPKRGRRYRPELIERAGKAQFPYLIDPNTNTEMYESMDIVRYLFETYGNDGVPAKWRSGSFQTLRSMLISAVRPAASLWAKPSQNADQLLVLYSGETSPGARNIRELLCQLELAFVVRQHSGPPKLVDPNTQSEFTGKQAIVDHLRSQYAA
jgi:glutathione S-transferase